MRFLPQAVLQISGKDALAFLQGQLTCDMREVTAEKPHRAALCNNKGRVIASMEIQKESKNTENFLLFSPKIMLPIIIKTLEKYGQFSEVVFTQKEANLLDLDLLYYIRQKIAVILTETSGLYTPHELNYHELDFISFDKGCYIGQEIIARMHYLGKLKKSLCYAKLSSIENIADIVNSLKISDTAYEVLIIQ